MHKKRILLVSNGFFPEISPRSFRATELAAELARQGHEVSVLTKYREHDYSGFLEKNALKLKMWGKPSFRILPVYKKRVPGLLSRAINRLLLMLFEYPAIEDMFSVRHALKDEQGYDLLISIAVPYPVHWGVAWSRTKKHPIAKTWISDCGDPFMGNVTDTYRKLFYFKYVEKWWGRKTDLISIPVESARSAYYKEFQSKIIIIPQGLKFDDIDLEDRYTGNPVPTFAYTGMFIPGIRDPRKFLDHLVSLDRDFRFFIYTNDQKLLAPYKGSLKEKLIVKDYIPRKELLEKLATMDFLVNFDNNTDKQVPSKLIDYKLSGRPVMNVTSEPDLAIIAEFLEGNYTNALAIGDISQFDIRNVAQQFATQN